MKKWNVFKEKSINAISNELVVNTLMCDEIKNYIIETGELQFLKSILNSTNNRLKNFYFNKDTINSILNIIYNANDFDILRSSYFFDNFYDNNELCMLLANYHISDRSFISNLPNMNYIFSILNGYLHVKNYDSAYFILKKIKELNINELKIDCLINILSKPEIIKNIAECYYENMFILILNKILDFDIESLTIIYTSKEFMDRIRENNFLDGVYGAINGRFRILDKKFLDVEKILLDRDNLKEVGKKYNEEIFSKFGKVHPNFCFPSIQYSYDDDKFDFGSINSNFKSLFKNYDNIEVKYKILDFFLVNSEYWSAFWILKKSLQEPLLRDYFKTRKNLIDGILKSEKSNEKFLIFYDLYGDILNEELCLERENLFLDIPFLCYYSMIISLHNEYKFSDKVLNNPSICSIFLDNYSYDKNGESSIKEITADDFLAHKIFLRTKKYKLMQKMLMRNLNDSTYDFWVYLDIIKKSSFQDIYASEFINDMKDIFFYSKPKRIREIFYKYKKVDLNKMKDEILERVKIKSTNDIINSLTNISDRIITKEVFKIEKRKIVIPVIYFKGEKFNFLCRRMQNANHLFNGKYREKDESYSIICEENRSVYKGDSGIKFGYLNIRPEDIVHINSLDSICNNFYKNKYHCTALKTPEWLLMDDLNYKTKLNGTYNELRIKGKQIPDFVISYDEPNDETVKYAYEHGVPLVKILRKSYPVCIENCDDIYANWQ